MRVCHVALTLRTGGLERLLVEFARHHDRERVEPVFVSLRDEGPPAEAIRALGREVHVLGAPRGKLHEMLRLVRLLRRLRPDVVHTHNLHAHLYGSPAARLARVPVVIHTRHGVPLGATRHGELLFRLASPLADRVVSVSGDTARLSARQGRLRPGQGVTIWNGIDLERFPYRGPGAPAELVTVSRLEPVKDLPTLLSAVALARRERADLRLAVVGDGSVRADLERLADSLRLAEAVRFLGERADVASLLAGAGTYVSASLTEGVSLTLLEAMAVGLPAVVTAVGGNPEVVVDGVTGLLVPPGDAKGLAEAILRVVSAPERGQGMGREARARVEAHFEVRQMVRRYEDLYAEVRAGKGGSGARS